MNTFRILLPLLAVVVAPACGETEQAADASAAAAKDAGGAVETNCPAPDENGIVEIRDGLTATITRAGYGRAARSLDYADVHTTLWLYDEAADGGRGTEIWASGGVRPFQFQLDAGQVIEGWDLGVRCMRLGETRELKIAPALGYGESGKPPVPPNATLLFEIELVSLTSP